MKITLNPRGESHSLNPVATVTASEVLELLEVGTEVKLSAGETVIALPIVQSLKQQGSEFTLREVILKFKAVEELANFASSCEKVFLTGGDYSRILETPPAEFNAKA